MTIKGWTMAFLSVILSAFLLQLLVMYFSDEAPGAIVLFPPEGFISAMPQEIALVGAGPNWIALRSDNGRLGRKLYSAGARLVLPAGLPGCLPLPGASGQNTPL